MTNNIHPIGNFQYIKPGSLDEALDVLKKNGPGVKAIAGGTDLIPQMKQHQISPPSMVLDVKNIPELRRLEWLEDQGLIIGAAVPLSQILAYPPVLEKFGVIAQGCGVIGSRQIKNRGTLGGNICNASPSADSAPALLSMNAKAIVASSTGTRKLELQDFFVSPGKTALGDDELLVAVEVPNPTGHSAGCYLRHTIREEMDVAAAGVAAFVVMPPENSHFQMVRIALGAVSPTPIRSPGAEAQLNGKPVTIENVSNAADKAAEDTQPISDLRASPEYRRELVKVLTRRTLRKACETMGIELK